MTAWTNEDVYADELDGGAYGVGTELDAPSQGAMRGASLNGTHTVEQSGQHVAVIALVAVVVLVIFNRLNIHAAVAGGAG